MRDEVSMIRGTLEGCIGQFKLHQGKHLYSIILATPESHLGEFDEMGSEPFRADLVFPSYVDHYKDRELYRNGLPEPHSSGRLLRFFGDPEALEIYRAIAKPAGRMLASLAGLVSDKGLTSLVRDSLTDVRFIEGMASLSVLMDLDEAWTMAVHDFLEDLDPGSGSWAQLWYRQQYFFSPARMRPLSGRKEEADLVRDVSPVWHTLAVDLFRSSAIAAESLLGLIANQDQTTSESNAPPTVPKSDGSLTADDHLEILSAHPDHDPPYMTIGSNRFSGEIAIVLFVAELIRRRGKRVSFRKFFRAAGLHKEGHNQSNYLKLKLKPPITDYIELPGKRGKSPCLKPSYVKRLESLNDTPPSIT